MEHGQCLEFCNKNPEHGPLTNQLKPKASEDKRKFQNVISIFYFIYFNVFLLFFICICTFLVFRACSGCVLGCPGDVPGVFRGVPGFTDIYRHFVTVKFIHRMLQRHALALYAFPY